MTRAPRCAGGELCASRIGASIRAYVSTVFGGRSADAPNHAASCCVGQLVMTRPNPVRRGQVRPVDGWPHGGSGAYAMNGNARYFVAGRHVEFAGTTSNLLRATGDQRAEGPLRCRSAHHMSDEFDGLDAIASKIRKELRNKRTEHFVDKLKLTRIHETLERAADVLSTVKGSQARRT